MRFNLSSVKYGINDIKKDIRIPKKMTEELAEEIGWHVGDGSMNYYSNKGLYQLRGHLKDDRLHYLDYISNHYKKLYNLEPNIRNMVSTGVLGFQIWSDAIVSFKHCVIGLPLGKKGNIQIPESVLKKKYFFAFVRGLFDTDGSIYFENKRGKPYPRIDIKTTSEALANGVYSRLMMYGINACIYEYKRIEKNWNNLFSVIIRGYPNITKWMDKIGTSNPKHRKKMKSGGFE